MAMMPMKRLHLVLLETQREALFKQLQRLGCVELSYIELSGEALDGEALNGVALVLKPDSADLELLEAQGQALTSALAALKKHQKPAKSKLFPELPHLSPESLEDFDALTAALDIAKSLNGLQAEIDDLNQEQAQLKTQLQSLMPWQALELPLEVKATKTTAILLGILPFATDPQSLLDTLAAQCPALVALCVHSDREQHYLALAVHRSHLAAAEAQLGVAGFVRTDFGDLTGTVQEQIAILENRLQAIDKARGDLVQVIQSHSQHQSLLESCSDGLALKRQRQELRLNLLRSKRALMVAGWVPEANALPVANALEALGCAYEIAEPGPEETPPVAYQQPRLVSPFAIIATLYGTPRYGSVVDPTPFLAPFFLIFFGIMMSDGAYGILMTLIALWALRHQKEPGIVRQIMVLALFLGLSTLFWGAVFGSWFGDFVPVITRFFTGTAFALKPLWFDPLKQPMDMLAFSFALGALQVLVGLGLSGWRKIRQGHWLDALLDVGLWYVLLLGLVLALFKVPYSLETAGVGALGIILTANRSEPNLLKRYISGILSLYGVTGYLADVLSYSRLLALGLASGVVASVVNGISIVGGKSVLGLVFLVFVFLIGHAFNLAINLVGAYVHASRLQYVEFFSKFFEGGGKPFKPVVPTTKYTRL